MTNTCTCNPCTCDPCACSQADTRVDAAPEYAGGCGCGCGSSAGAACMPECDCTG